MHSATGCSCLRVLTAQGMLQEMATDVHCIIEAMVGRTSEVSLLTPCIDGVPSCVMGDPDRLRGILLNLYTNAAKFTRKGGLALHISVSGPNFQPSPHQDGRHGAHPTRVSHATWLE